MQQLIWYTVLILQCCCGLLLAAPFEVASRHEEVPADMLRDDTAEQLQAAAAAFPQDMGVRDWMRLLLHTHDPTDNELSQPVYPQKRISGLGVPYLKYHFDKRNNGVWIWMPAQGYVSVPRKQHQGDTGNGKSGKIMRYGKRSFQL